jgi:hypothetical protein
MFECPFCKSIEARRLIIPSDGKEMKCNLCYEIQAYSPVGLQDVVAQNGKVKVTKGKAWEIRNRVKSKDDNWTCINSKTGKPTQF